MMPGQLTPDHEGGPQEHRKLPGDTAAGAELMFLSGHPLPTQRRGVVQASVSHVFLHRASGQWAQKETEAQNGPRTHEESQIEPWKTWEVPSS